jgi:hypothetical protein
MANSIQPQIARFEDFEVHLEPGEVWKAGSGSSRITGRLAAYANDLSADE